MNEAKPQDGSTVKGYRTLTADDIAQMNDLKEISRNFCEQLDTERTHLSLETVNAGSPEDVNRGEAVRCLAIARTKMHHPAPTAHSAHRQAGGFSLHLNK